MAVLDAREVDAKLTSLGSDADPKKQLYKTELARDHVELCHPTSKDDNGDPRVTRVRANHTQDFLAKGFTFVPVNVSVAPEEDNVPAKGKK